MNASVRKMIPALLATAILAGCAHTQYVPSGMVFLGRPDAITYSEKKGMVLEAVDMLVKDPMFSKVYAEKKTALEKAAKKQGKEAPLPLIAMDALRNSTGNGVSDGRELGQVSRDLQTKIRQTGLFDMTDDFTAPDMIDRIISGGNGGEEGGLEGEYRFPDLWLTGDLQRVIEQVEIGETYTFTLNLQLMDTATKKVFWSGSVERTKVFK